MRNSAKFQYYLPLPFCVIGILQELQIEKADGFSLNSTITSKLFNNTELQDKGSFESSRHMVGKTKAVLRILWATLVQSMSIINHSSKESSFLSLFLLSFPMDNYLNIRCISIYVMFKNLKYLYRCFYDN